MANEAKNIGDAVVDRETEQGFTPEPWRVIGEELRYTDENDLYAVIQTPCAAIDVIAPGVMEAEHMANARLMAAAPALCKAARFARSVLAANPMEMSERMAIEKLDAALALANKPADESAKRTISDRGNDSQASKSESV